MESTKEIFANKGFSDEVLYYLENAINEIDNLFGSYWPKDVILERIQNNVDTISFEDVIDEYDDLVEGRYDRESKSIIIKNTDEENIKETIFHELIHAIAPEGAGFYRFYNVNDTNGEVLMGKGFDEGFVQYLTELRNKKFSKTMAGQSYPILNQSVEQVLSILGFDDVMNTYFNNPDSIFNLLGEKTKSNPHLLLLYYDTILNNEYSINRNAHLSQKPDLLRNMFSGEYADQNLYSPALITAQDGILQLFLDKTIPEAIDSEDTLEEVVKKISESNAVLARSIGINTVKKIYEHLSPQMLANIDELDSDFKEPLISYRKYLSTKDMDLKTKLEKISSEDDNYLFGVISDLPSKYSTLESDFYTKMLEDLYEGIPDFSIHNMSNFVIHFSEVVNYIRENNLDFENIRIVYSEIGNGDCVYELFNTEGEDKEVAILYGERFSDELVEMHKVGEEESQEIKTRIYNTDPTMMMMKMRYPIESIYRDDEGHTWIRDNSSVPYSAYLKKESVNYIVPKTIIDIDSIATMKSLDSQYEPDSNSQINRYMSSMLLEERIATLDKYVNSGISDLFIIKDQYNRVMRALNQMNELHYTIRATDRAAAQQKSVEDSTSSPSTITVDSIKNALIGSKNMPNGVNQMEEEMKEEMEDPEN